MALFGSARDASLLRSVNRELINRYIDTEVGLYKLDLQSTPSNLYNEAKNKVYYEKIKMNCIIEKDERSTVADEYGLDYTRTATFSFLRDDLKDKNIVVEQGDVLEYDGEFLDVDKQKTIKWDSNKFKIEWPCTNPIISKRDANGKDS